MSRTLAINTVKKVNKDVTLYGWINSRRDHGGIIFLDLRDRSGVVQVVTSGVEKAVGMLQNECVVKVVGRVNRRPRKLINPNLATGKVEVKAKKIEILAASRELPLPIDTDGYEINEDIRLKYRYLDLRRPRLNRNIKLRSFFVQKVRQFFFDHDFVEIETPILTKSTPEGSRDFIVPSRLHQGKFYALPQSPQQYKQLLMAAGFERYFQIAKCLRDEDTRADRSFEHTQIDIEMSFVEREDVMSMDEQMITWVMEGLGYQIKDKPFPVFTYQKALEKFGSDKFDLRTKKEKKDGILAFAWVIDFPFFEKTGEGEWTFTHNPFSNPKPEHKDWLLKKKNIGKILTSQYDLVCNGYEVGGGSIRSHEAEVLQSVFEIIGYKSIQVKEQFGHMLEAFQFGVPPHGGLAHGIERLLMIITNEAYLREVVAFPMSASGRTSVMDAPSKLDKEQLKELGLKVVKQKSKRDIVYQKIVNMLKDTKIEFETYQHKPVYRSEEAARVRGTTLHQGAKALIMYADNKPVMLVLPADCKVDTRSFKKKFAVKDLRMATADQVKKLTGIEIGAVPPFGSIFGLVTYVDRSLQENREIVFNAGLHTKSIKMKELDYRKVANPEIAKFAHKK